MNKKDKIRALVNNNQLEEATSLCVSTCKNYPDDAEAWFLYGMLNGLLKNFVAANDCYDNVIRLMPDLMAAYYNKGIALQSLHRYEDAVTAFNTVIRLDPEFENINQVLADVFFALNDDKSALSYYLKILKTEPDNIYVLYKIGSLRLKEIKYHEAEGYFRQIILLNPDNTEALFSLGSALQLQGDLDAAEEYYNQAIELRPDYFLAYNNLGILHKERKKFDIAINFFSKAVSHKADYAEAYNNLGHAYQILEKYDLALAAYKKLVELKPNNSEAHYCLGLQYEELGRYSLAREHFSQASLMDADDIRYLYVLARVFSLENKYDEAISCYERILEKDDSFIDAYISMGKVSLESGNRMLATESFKRAIIKQPDHVTANYYLAELDPTHEITKSQNQYIEVLFDEYADSFEKDLTKKLAYKTPGVVYHEVKKFLPLDKGLVIFDLGCGTGLCGEFFRPYARRLVGIDLSSKIIAKARSKSIYDELYVDEITIALDKEINAVDLILAADVFVYIGDLQAIFESVCRVLKPDSLFSFSVEHKRGEHYAIQGNGRYLHSVEYIKHLANNMDLQLLSHTPSVLRKELGIDVQGDVYVYKKQALLT